MSDEELDKRVKDLSVYARVTLKIKFELFNHGNVLALL